MSAARGSTLRRWCVAGVLALVAVGVCAAGARALDDPDPALADVSLRGTPLERVASGTVDGRTWTLTAGTVTAGPNAGNFCAEYRVGEIGSALCFDDARDVAPLVSAYVDGGPKVERVVFGVVAGDATSVRLVDGDRTVEQVPTTTDRVASVDFFVIRVPVEETASDVELVALDAAGSTVTDRASVLPAS